MTNINEVMGNLINKAHEDSSFKQMLIENPESILNDYGVSLVNKKKIKVVDQTDPSQLFLIIPSISSKDHIMELTEEQLESVAGGFTVNIEFEFDCDGKYAGTSWEWDFTIF